MNLRLKNITKKYDEQFVLNNIDFAIDHVGSIGIIGESGCGKSTLLRLLAGIEEPQDGEIEINQLSPIKDKLAFQNKIGYVFQQHNLFPHLTIEENISLILEKTKGIPKEKSEEIANYVLKTLHLSAVAKKLPSQVSGGQAQRASIARALATNPELIFLDEPTAALDPILTQEVLQSIKELKKTGVDFVFVTHEMQFLKVFCDYFIFMKDGRICESGYVDCLENPQTQELKIFLQIANI